MSRVKQVARSDAIAFKPEDWSAIRAELDGIEPDNMTAEADLRKADLAENPDAQIRETVYKVRGLARQVRAANQRRLGSIHSPVAWMLARIGAMIVDMEAEAQREAAARSAEQTAAAVKVKAEAVKKEAVKVSPAAVEKGREAWKAILGYLETQVIRQSFETWLKPTKGGWIKGKILTVRVPSEEFNHIGEKYSDFIQAAIESLKLNVQDVTFITEG